MLRLCYPLLFFLSCLLASCHTSSHTPSSMTSSPTKTIYFAGGCFWGTEHFFKQLRGVVSTEVGYANGHTEHPSYEDVCRKGTGHAETVKVVYAPHIIGLDELIDLYLQTIDATSLNRQGNDVGTQYRTGIYYTDSIDRPTIDRVLDAYALQLRKPMVVEREPLQAFYPAEDYHQDYLDNKPGGYCHLAPQLFQMARAYQPKSSAPRYVKPSNEELRQRLSELQYAVTQKGATERAFFNDYWDEKREGIYVDITTGEPLFLSTHKFDSGCGWPSFSQPIEPSLIEERDDSSHGMQRVEVRSKTGDAHLGHVFTDGPKSLGGLRYCINSAALRFVPKADMEREGYGAYLPLVKAAPQIKH